MRPVLLEMNGFACFREPAQVDFTGADFFALVGPTGAGKSTVIDAMTFALYGSVPRWGRRGMVSLALAPTVTRGTVKLIFEVEGRRYVVARELRRMSGQVHQRAASLERLENPAGVANPGDPTEPLARDLAGVTDAVERLLGLSYEDFCQCVVLPQGQFANFLHARPGDRQDILLRLLGAEHYRQMMMMANQRTTNAGQRADALNETLTTFADATQAAEDATRGTEQNLNALKNRTDAAIPGIHQAEQQLATAQSQLAQLIAERDTLTAVQVPDNIASLDESLRTARSAVERSRAEEKAAEEADRAARTALATGPQRGPLERIRDQRAELASQTARLPEAESDAARLSVEAAEAALTATRAASVIEDARSKRDDASREHEEVAQRVGKLEDDHAVLTGVAVPPEVSQLDQRHRKAEATRQEASAALQAAEQADSEARAARTNAAPSAPLEQAMRDLRDLSRNVSELAAAQSTLIQARTGRSAAEAALQTSEAASQQAAADLDAARRANVIADLRPHLVQGHTCPLCEQTVGTLPAALLAPAIDQAQAAFEKTRTAVLAARDAIRTAASAEDTATARIASMIEQQARTVSSLTTAAAGPLATTPVTALRGMLGVLATQAGLAEGRPTQPAPYASASSEELSSQVEAATNEVETIINRRRDLDNTAEAAAAAAESARETVRVAEAQLNDAQNAIATARTALNTARDPLVALGAPPADDASLAVAWTGLAAWAAEQAEIRSTALASARDTASTAAAKLGEADTAFRQAQAALTQARDAAVAAAKAEQDALTRVTELTGRIDSLHDVLARAPEEMEVEEQLALVSLLEQEAAGFQRNFLAARTQRATAEQELAELEQAESAARSMLIRARDPIVALGAPGVDPERHGLLASWSDLSKWAAAEAAARETAITATGQVRTARQTTLSQLTTRLSAELAAAGIDIAPEDAAANASAAVAAALERARAATARISERRREATDLLNRRDTEVDRQRNAHMLAELLRSNRFPRWLVTAAVDVLVAEASEILADLSNDQYDLTHEDGDFYIIDHTDADSRRSVRTLSGGETFQASLALALALSSQLTSLAAAGAARLDSIFLDEGFGTLDPETLDVVATTLENLSQGPRMVGVVTHVAALADRVPVRYAVSRDARTSTVTRQGLASSEAL